MHGGGASGPKTVYAISNQDTKTLFAEDLAGVQLPVTIQAFDKFQESLLRNYSFYSPSVCQARQTASLRSTRTRPVDGLHALVQP